MSQLVNKCKYSGRDITQDDIDRGLANEVCFFDAVKQEGGSKGANKYEGYEKQSESISSSAGAAVDDAVVPKRTEGDSN